MTSNHRTKPELDLAPLQEDRSTLVEKVCRRLARSIRQDQEAGQGNLAGGALLPPERELAVRFGVSRPVVREATKRLELQGLLEVRHGIGTRVVDRLHAPLSGSIHLLVDDAARRLRQSLELRLVLEPEVARRVAAAATPEVCAGLRAVHARLEQAGTLEEAVAADMDFHRELARLCGNDIFALVLSSMAELGRASRQATIGFAGVEVARDHHARILRAIEAGRPDKARAAMQAHLEAAMADLQEAAAAVPARKRARPSRAARA